MPTVGPIYASSVVSATGSGATWSSTANAVGSTTGNYASAAITGTTGQGILRLRFSNDGTVPIGSTITQVDGDIRSYVSNTTNISNHYVFLYLNGSSEGGRTLTRTTSVAERPATWSPAAVLASDVDAIEVRVYFDHTSANSTSVTGFVDRVGLTITYTAGGDNGGFFF